MRDPYYFVFVFGSMKKAEIMYYVSDVREKLRYKIKSYVITITK